MNIDFDFYKHNENVPIKELAEHLGLKRDSKGKYQCPCHNDTHPSMIITEQGKYENQFNCYACGEHGGVLQLTLAVRHKINPSEYWKDRQKYQSELYESAQYIDELYPGGLCQGIEEKYNPDGSIKFPIITESMLIKLGLQRNMLKPVIEVQSKYNDEVKNGIPPQIRNERYRIDETDEELAEKVDIILQKIDDYLKEHQEEEYKKIINRFPQLPQVARLHIANVIAKESEQYIKLYKNLQEYADTHFQNIEWINEELEERER